MGRSTIATLVGLAAIVALAFWCASCHRGGIEEDLVKRSQAELAQAGLTGLDLSAIGRDMTLSGTVASDAERSRALETAKVWGVRVVTDDLTVAAAPPPLVIGTAWSLDAARGDDRGLTWTGEVSPSTLQELQADAGPFFDGASAQIDVQTRDEDSAQWTPEQRAAVRAALPFLATVPASSLSASPERLVLRGAPDSLRQAQAVRRALAPRLPDGMALDLQWDRAWSADELTLEVAERDGLWDLSGLVPQDTAVGWADKVRSAGLEPLESSLIEADVEAPAGFGTAFEGALSSLSGLPGGRLVETKGSLDFSGLSDDAALAKRLEDSVGASLPAGVDLRFSVAPKLESGDCQAQLERELAAEKILFASGSAALDARSDSLLRRLSTTLRRCPGASVRIEGHTDSDGDEVFNQGLSTRRADAVKRRMVALGVAPLRLEAEGFGETRPIASGNTPQAKSQNRRIEFRLQEDA